MSVLIAMFVLLAILLVFAMRFNNEEANEEVKEINEVNIFEVKDVCPACGHALTEEDTECPGCGLQF